MIDRLSTLAPTNLKEVLVALREAIDTLRTDAEQQVAFLQTDPAVASSITKNVATIEVLVRAAHDMEKLEARARKIMEKVLTRLRKK